MRTFWLFQHKPTGLSRGKQACFWLWNLAWVLAAGICLGGLSLLYAYGTYPSILFRSYFVKGLIAFLNILPVAGLTLLLWLLTGRAWTGFLLSGVVTLGFSIGNYFKLQFRDDPVMFEDLKYLREVKAITAAAQYDLTPDKRILFGVGCVVLGTAALWLFARGVPRKRVRLPLALVLCLAAVPVSRLYTDTEIYNVKTRNIDFINQWSSTQVYLSKGFVYPFLHSISTGIVRPPEGYSQAQTEALLASYTDQEIPEEERVDLITIQLEAFADFSYLTEVEGVDWTPAYETYHALEAESYTGDLLTNIFAGGTVNTERLFLTGLCSYQNFRAETNSYAWYLQTQGYRTEGSHPCYQWFYNRRNVNRYLGITDYWYFENRFQELSQGGIAPDSVLMPEIFRLYAENRDGAGDPYLSFNVTYQGHGPYSTEENTRGVDYTDGRYSTETTNIVNNYLGSVADTAEQLRWLLDQFRGEDRPVVVVVFGDHKPWLGDGNSAYQELGISLDTTTEAGFRNYYGTRYLIWANDAAKAALGNDFTGEGEDTSSCFLMSVVFEQCGWQGSAYMQATEQVRQVLPVITSVGYCEEKGQLTKELSDEGQAALKTFRCLEYDHYKWFLYDE